MGQRKGGIGALFTAEGWKGPKSFFQNLVDPAGLVLNLEESTPNVRPPPVEDKALVEAKERERRRLGSGSRSTVVSQGRANALSGSIGKRLLGGTQ